MSAVNLEKPSILKWSHKKTKSSEKIPAIFFMSIDLVNHINHSKTKISRALLNSGHMQDNVIV